MRVPRLVGHAAPHPCRQRLQVVDAQTDLLTEASHAIDPSCIDHMILSKYTGC